MDRYRPYFVVALIAAITLIGLTTGVVGLFMVAFVGAILTVGLRTGSLAPLFPAVSLKQAPVPYWVVMTAAAVVVIANIVILLTRP